MKKHGKAWWLGVVILSPFALFFLYNVIGIIVYLPAKGLIATYRIYSADRVALLQACRQMLADRDAYRNDWPEWRLAAGNKALDSEKGEIPPNVPAIIRQMKPRYIIIKQDHVLVMVHAPPRTGFIGCLEGADDLEWLNRIGAQKWTNGLWYFDH